jgi:2'-5' RNA ligase
MGMVRAFIAVELNSAVRTAISNLQAQVKAELHRELRQSVADIRLQWVKPESIHLTLKFLGDIREEQVDGICSSLMSALATQSCFLLEVGGLGVFPDLRAPRVLWIGLEQAERNGPSPAVQLAETVERAMTSLEFFPDAKPFTPHLTLARIKERSREVGKVLSSLGLLAKGRAMGTLPVNAVSLMRSDLQPSGAVYTRLCEIPLSPTD